MIIIFSKRLNNFISPFDRTKTTTNYLSQNLPGVKNVEEILNIPNSSKTGAAHSDVF